MVFDNEKRFDGTVNRAPLHLVIAGLDAFRFEQSIPRFVRTLYWPWLDRGMDPGSRCACPG
ncbi:hypothetical protein TRICHSKD4_5126 [Roseibium sp. TrichSKD4]|nr:hypothetical protein TRICHSKD4_5126 [Roseibium sp. TrichSKD4]